MQYCMTAGVCNLMIIVIEKWWETPAAAAPWYNRVIVCRPSLGGLKTINRDKLTRESWSNFAILVWYTLFPRSSFCSFTEQEVWSRLHHHSVWCCHWTLWYSSCVCSHSSSTRCVVRSIGREGHCAFIARSSWTIISSCAKEKVVSCPGTQKTPFEIIELKGFVLPFLN